MDVYIGLDPGADGGLMAIFEKYYQDSGPPEVTVRGTKMPETEAGIWSWLKMVGDLMSHEEAGEPCRVYCCLEKVTGYVAKAGREGFAHGGQTGHSMFTFGMSYGALRMAVTAFGLKENETFWCVTPTHWQAALGIRTRLEGESDSQWKNHLRSVAVDLFPRVVVTLAFADALLLARYCKGKVAGEFSTTTTKAKRAAGGR